MARIVMSMSGEGRGHAVRARALVEHLRHRHELRLLCPGSAFDLLAPELRGSGVQVEAIPGIQNQYDSQRKLDYLRLGSHLAGYFSRLPRLLDGIRRRLDDFRPDLAISDFEPALPRAAHLAGLPFMAIDHQHALLASDLSALPIHLRMHAAIMGCAVRAVYRHRPCRRVLSSFYAPPLKRGFEDVRQVGVFLRAGIRRARPRRGEHLVVYLRRFAPPALLDHLAGFRRPVIVYGLGDGKPRGCLRFRRIDGPGFIDDLASAAALVTTAGNQIVGEALSLGKPVFAMPEAQNYEQAINAFFLEASGAGLACPLEETTAGDLAAFLERLPDFAPRGILGDGAVAAAREVEQQLEQQAGRSLSLACGPEQRAS